MSFSSPAFLRRACALASLAVLLVAASACDLAGTSDGDVTLTGRVLEATTQNPVEEAVITMTFTDASGQQEEVTTVTDSLGRFSTSIEVNDPVDVTITASKGGISAQRTERVSSELGTVTGLRFELNMGAEAEPEPGRPTNIVLESQSASVLRVKGSGGTEVAQLTFQVVDSTGTPIDVDQAVDVRFRFGQQPGDATFSPDVVRTDGQGRATVNVSSGTIAGVAQVVAETEKADGTPIRSKPVRLTIHGGLPNKCHFSLGPDQFNFPGLRAFGVTNEIDVIVGDKYGNPVVPGTAVYFSTNAGVIGGSVETGANGQGSVTLTSARPVPAGGVGTVQAETVGTDDVNDLVDPNNCDDPASTGNENRIFDTIPVVFSGRTQVEVTPAAAQLGQTYDLVVRDVENGNPLAPGTTIDVTAEGTKVKAVGNTEVELDDTAVIDANGDGFDGGDVITGDGITRFTFRVVEDNNVDETGVPTVEAVTITVSSPNGNLEVVLTPPSAEDGATLAKRGSTVRASTDATIRWTAPQTVTVQADN